MTADAPERIWAKVDIASADMSGALRLIARDAPWGEYRGDPAIEYVRADIHAAYLNAWKCPIGMAGCVRNCGSYGCGN